MHSSLHGRALRAPVSLLILVLGGLSPLTAQAEEAPASLALAPQGAFVLQPPDSGRQTDTALDQEPTAKTAEPRAVRVGLLAGVGVPGLMNFGVTTRVTRYLGLGATVGLIPTVQVPLYGQATLSYQEYDAYLRVYPFGGGFFLGSGVGYAKVTGSFTQSATVPAMYGYAAQEVSLKSDASVRSLVITPKIGYLFTSDAGFLLGVDLGAQVPIAPSQTSLSTSIPAAAAPYTTAATSEVNSSLARIGQQVIPTMSVNLGWLF
jgi:hypothetical protein